MIEYCFDLFLGFELLRFFIPLETQFYFCLVMLIPSSVYIHASSWLYAREQYDKWKAECKKMAPVIGSGTYVTAPIISEEGRPLDGASCTPDSSSVQKKGDETADKNKELKWKLTLHQIGKSQLLSQLQQPMFIIPFIFYNNNSILSCITCPILPSIAI